MTTLREPRNPRGVGEIGGVGEVGLETLLRFQAGDRPRVERAISIAKFTSARGGF